VARPEAAAGMEDRMAVPSSCCGYAPWHCVALHFLMMMRRSERVFIIIIIDESCILCTAAAFAYKYRPWLDKVRDNILFCSASPRRPKSMSLIKQHDCHVLLQLPTRRPEPGRRRHKSMPTFHSLS
jgi:hypothetical protein